MDNNNNNTYLEYSFSNKDAKLEHIAFVNPKDTIIATSTDEVLPALEKIQTALNQGYYAAGYLSYEAAPAFNNQLVVHSENEMPLLWFGIYDKISNPSLNGSKSYSTTDWTPNIPVKTYNEHIDKIHEYIKQEKTKQVNYTLQMESKVEGDSYSFYKQLKEVQSNYSAYLHIGDYTILSASPELFFQLKDDTLTARPMKGTIGRGLTYEEDMENAAWLAQSEKNKLENKMVVELMTEELKAVAKPNSIRVASAYDVERYPTVYQMTSTIQADIDNDKTITDIFNALFPCGSITGQPKETTMEIIRELETTTREVYCGTIGFITPSKEAIFNVPIRTVVINNNDHIARYGVGGAITIDSTKEEEYEEVLTKAAVLNEKRDTFQLLETIGLVDGEYIVFDKHMKRLTESGTYFEFRLDLNKIKDSLDKIAAKHNSGYYRVRLVVEQDGNYSIETNKIENNFEEITATIAKTPIDKHNVFLYHKTTNRSTYENKKNEVKHTDDVLMWNESREITEFTTGNIVVELNGELLTPPISCGLLGGTFRSALLDKGEIKEKVITLDELKACTNIWFINSVRKWVPVKLS